MTASCSHNKAFQIDPAPFGPWARLSIGRFIPSPSADGSLSFQAKRDEFLRAEWCPDCGSLLFGGQWHAPWTGEKHQEPLEALERRGGEP